MHKILDSVLYITLTASFACFVCLFVCFIFGVACFVSQSHLCSGVLAEKKINHIQ